MFHPSVRLSSPLWRYVAMLLDGLLIAACAQVTYLMHFDNAPVFSWPARYSTLTLAAIVMMYAGAGAIYKSWRGNQIIDILRPVALGWIFTLILLVTWLFITKASSDISRLWFGEWAVATLISLIVARLLAFGGLRWLRTEGYNFKTLLIVGRGGASCEFTLKAIENAPWSGLQVQAVVTPELLAWHIATQLQRQPDEVWLCLPMGDKAGIEKTLEALRHSTANIRLVPDWFSLKLINHGISEVVGLHMLDLSSSPMTGMTHVVKVVQDFLLGALITLLISPLMLVIALAVKLTSPGPVLFIQKRSGWNGEDIWVYKFRSMVMHQEADFAVTQATRADPRITPLGAFLRRTSLDELPQFINVLQGRMSIVGPRPHAVQHNDYYKQLVPGYMLRHKVKPGITGWAQINGYRGETDTLDKMEMRVKYDLHYVENISLRMDLKIIFLTLFKGFVHRNAH